MRTGFLNVKIDEVAIDIPEISIETVKTRAVKGVLVLTGRTFFLSIISLVATGFLTVLLEPSQFGVFWIVSAVVNFLAYFSDVGLAAALIQKKEKPEKEDLRTTFTLQQILVFGIIAIIVGGTPIFARIYSLSQEGVFLLYSLGISLFLSSLKTIPSVLMERELEFTKLVIPQIVENLVYNLVVVFLAWKGYGISSFTYAILARGVVGLVIIYILKPWKPAIGIDRGSLRGLLRFGIPYQANTFLATIKDDGLTAVLGGILGPAGMGYLGWAQKWGYAPLRFFMDHVLKITFPAFSRMQDNKDELRRTLTRSIFFICFLVFPMLIGLITIAPVLVKVIPRYEKWTPALIALALIGVNTIFAAVTTQLTNLLNSIGKIKITFKLMLMWTSLTWMIVPFLAIKFGVNGAAFGYAAVSVSSVIAIFIARKYVEFSLWDSAVKPLLAAGMMGLSVMAMRHYLVDSWVTVAVLIVLGLFVYTIIAYFLIGQSLINDIKKSYKTIVAK